MSTDWGRFWHLEHEMWSAQLALLTEFAWLWLLLLAVYLVAITVLRRLER